jgi:hypothetical protein
LETIFEYSLPSQVFQFESDSYEYTLLVQKQPGSRNVPVRVHLLLPPGAEILTASPSPLQSAEVGLVFDLTLRADQAIAVTFQLSD